MTPADALHARARIEMDGLPRTLMMDHGRPPREGEN